MDREAADSAMLSYLRAPIRLHLHRSQLFDTLKRVDVTAILLEEKKTSSLTFTCVTHALSVAGYEGPPPAARFRFNE